MMVYESRRKSGRGKERPPLTVSNVDGIELRTVRPDDWTIWRDLRLAALAEAPYAFGSTLAQWQDQAEERWRASRATRCPTAGAGNWSWRRPSGGRSRPTGCPASRPPRNRARTTATS